MKRLAVALVLLGLIISLPLTASAVVLVVSMRDPATADLPASVTAFQREAGLSEVGDVVSVKGDDWTLDDQRFGTAECKNNPPANGGRHVCVEIPGLSRKEALPLIAPIFFTNEKGDQDIKRYRRFRINWEALPERLKNEAHYTGMVSLPDWRQDGFFLDKEAVR